MKNCYQKSNLGLHDNTCNGTHFVCPKASQTGVGGERQLEPILSVAMQQNRQNGLHDAQRDAQIQKTNVSNTFLEN